MKTTNENARNDKYAIIRKNDCCAKVVSYGENFINYINDCKLLSDTVEKSCLKDSYLFRDLVSKLDRAGYYVYQLTRL